MRKILAVLAVLVVAVTGGYAAEFGGLDVKSADLAAAVAGQALELPVPAPEKTAIKPEAVKAETEEIVSITGLVNRSRANVLINKTAGTITGGVNHRVINLKIDDEAGTISGAANYTPIRLNFKRAGGETVIEGAANLSPTKYTVNLEKGLLEGYTCLSPLKMEFDLKGSEAGPGIVTITGHVNRKPIRLQFDKAAGTMTGSLNHRPVNLKMEFSALGDFFEYFFLFAKDGAETSNE